MISARGKIDEPARLKQHGRSVVKPGDGVYALLQRAEITHVAESPDSIVNQRRCNSAEGLCVTADTIACRTPRRRLCPAQLISLNLVKTEADSTRQNGGPSTFWSCA